MKITRAMVGVVGVGVLMMAGATVQAAVTNSTAVQDVPSLDEPVKETKAAAMKSVFVCPEGHAMAKKAGQCGTCQKDLVRKHVLGGKDGQAMLCDCAADCKCDAKGVKEGKCACGKDVKMMACKGMHCCGMGCAMSDKAGKCPHCGMDMKQCK